MSKKHALRLALILAAVLLASPSAWAQLNFFSALEIRYDDNLGWAIADEDKVEDFTTRLDLGVNWKPVETQTSEVSVGGTVYYAWVADTSDLSHYGIKLLADYRGQTSPDFTAFWWDIDGWFKTLKYKDSEIRDGWWTKVTGTIGKRFTPVFGLSAGVAGEIRRSTESEVPGDFFEGNKVFDLDNWSAFLRAAFSLGADTEIFAAYTFRTGDVTSTGSGANWSGTSTPVPVALDPAFGPGQIVWRIDADQNIIDLGISHTFSNRFSMEFAVGYLDAEGQENLNYDNTYAILSGTFGF